MATRKACLETVRGLLSGVNQGLRGPVVCLAHAGPQLPGQWPSCLLCVAQTHPALEVLISYEERPLPLVSLRALALLLGGGPASLAPSAMLLVLGAGLCPGVSCWLLLPHSQRAYRQVQGLKKFCYKVWGLLMSPPCCGRGGARRGLAVEMMVMSHVNRFTWVCTDLLERLCVSLCLCVRGAELFVCLNVSVVGCVRV